MKKITQVQGKGIVIRGSDIDTDQIIPARYMKEVTFEGIEKYAFFDVRYDAQGNKKDHPFNDETFAGASVLIVNSNFGCGSSREHAPQTLMRSGIRAIIGESFAEIFAGNCTTLGVPTLCLTQEQVLEIQTVVEKDASVSIVFDIDKSTVQVGDTHYEGYIAPQVRKSLLDGTWDTTNVMLYNEKEIERVYNALPYIEK